jgi:hypothetical protein
MKHARNSQLTSGCIEYPILQLRHFQIAGTSLGEHYNIVCVLGQSAANGENQGSETEWKWGLIALKIQSVLLQQ